MPPKKKEKLKKVSPPPSSASLFLTEFNLKMLWQVILEDPRNSLLNPLVCKNIFDKTILVFYKTLDKTPLSLVEVNKKYLLYFMMNLRSQTQSQGPGQGPGQGQGPVQGQDQGQDQGQGPGQGQGQDSPPPPIVFDDKQQRLTEIELEYQKRQQEFASYMNTKTPPVPNFQDAPLTPNISLSDEIQRLKEERKYDSVSWLKPQETSTHGSTPFQQQEQAQLSQNRTAHLDKLLHPELAQPVEKEESKEEEIIQLNIENEEEPEFDIRKEIFEIQQRLNILLNKL